MANQEMKKININDMSSQQLMQFAKSLDGEINLLEASVVELNNAKQKFLGCVETCKGFKRIENGSKLMVPLTNSLYVPGNIANRDAFLLDIGTKFYIEKNLEGAIDYFERKVKFLNEQIDKLVKLLREKGPVRQSFHEVLLQKEQQQQQALLSQKQN